MFASLQLVETVHNILRKKNDVIINICTSKIFGGMPNYAYHTYLFFHCEEAALGTTCDHMTVT